MAKKYIDKEAQVVAERNTLSDREKKTRYARPGYVYVAPHSKFRIDWADDEIFHKYDLKDIIRDSWIWYILPQNHFNFE